MNMGCHGGSGNSNGLQESNEKPLGDTSARGGQEQTL